jgi:hypothetical protein
MRGVCGVTDLNLPSLKTIFSVRKGFTLVFPQAEVEGRLPSMFIHVTHQVKSHL